MQDDSRSLKLKRLFSQLPEPKRKIGPSEAPPTDEEEEDSQTPQDKADNAEFDYDNPPSPEQEEATFDKENPPASSGPRHSLMTPERMIDIKNHQEIKARGQEPGWREERKRRLKKLLDEGAPFGADKDGTPRQVAGTWIGNPSVGGKPKVS